MEAGRLSGTSKVAKPASTAGGRVSLIRDDGNAGFACADGPRARQAQIAQGYKECIFKTPDEK